MMQEAIAPVAVELDGPGGRDEIEYSHPAFGVILMTNPRGNRRDKLFGSDIGHTDVVRICISTACLKRSLSHDWIHERGQLLEFEMSHAQFAQFIMSSGNGSGTPITLRWTAEEGYLPTIKSEDTKYDMQRAEIKKAVHERIEAIHAEIDKLGAMIDTGKTPRAEIREIHRTLDRHVNQMAGSLDYTIRCAEEALEKATSDAKIEIETYIQQSAKRIGLSHISELARIEDKTTGQ